MIEQATSLIHRLMEKVKSVARSTKKPPKKEGKARKTKKRKKRKTQQKAVGEFLDE